MLRLFLILFAFVTLLCPVFAQHPVIMLPANAPLYYNSGFAGSQDRGRLVVAYNNRWLGLPEVGSFYASYDQLSNRLRGGIAVEAYHFMADGLNQSKVSGAYSPKFSLGAAWTLAPAIEIGLHSFQFNGTVSSVSQGLVPFQVNNFHLSSSIGVLLNTSNFYVGANWEQPAALKLAQLKDQTVTTRPIHHLNLQTGYVFKPSPDANWSLSAGAMTFFLRNNKQFMGNLMYRVRWFILGMAVNRLQFASLWTTTVLPSLGYKHDRFRVLASYNRAVTPVLGEGRYASAEISFSWYFHRKQPDVGVSGSAGL